MIDYDGFRNYRLEKGYARTGIDSCISMIGENRIRILNNFSEYQGLNNLEKLLKFENDDNITQKEFDNYHNYADNTNTFGDLKSVSKMYKDFRNQNNSGNKLINIEAKLKKLRNCSIKNIILYGAPGVGKTHNYQRIISLIENKTSEKEIFDTITNNTKIDLNNKTFQNIKDDKRVEFVTFHQNYSYEDFIEGFRPNEDGNIKLEDGIFKNIVNQALEQSKKNFYIVIDEINRGNISKIFGELITLIEEDKRDKYEVTLPYSKETFKIPSNLYIIATMNSTDKSIATIDIALRRRFTFLKMKPNLELVEDIEARKFMDKLNIYIESKLGEDYKLGHSYFMGKDIDLEFIKEYKIKPLLEEYFYAEEKTADDIIKEALAILKKNIAN